MPGARAAERISTAKSALYLGRDLHYPVALEGALKLKEISYIHAEGYPTAEMKHGPIALVDRETPCIFVAPRGSLHAKTLSNLEEVKARNGSVLLVSHVLTEVQHLCDRVGVVVNSRLVHAGPLDSLHKDPSKATLRSLEEALLDLYSRTSP